MESRVRVGAGVSTMAGGLALVGLTPLGIGLAAAGAMMVLTGVLGFCPACAMVGRRPVDGPR